MDRLKPLASTSRLPLLSNSTRLARTSLGKRDSDAAGLDQSGSNRKAASTMAMSHTALQRRVLALEGIEREQAQQIADQADDIHRLRSERGVLYEGEKHEKETGETREKEWGDERISLTAQMRELRQKNGTLEDTLARLQSEHAQLSNQHSTLTLNTNSEIALLQSRNKELEGEVQKLRQWERRARGLSIDLEEQKRRHEEGKQGQEDEVQDRQRDSVMRGELRRQAQHLVTLERNHAAMQTEVLDLRQKRKEFDAEQRVAKDIERSLRDQIHALQEQLDRSRREMDSLTQTFPSGSKPSEDASTLQARLQTLSELHEQAKTELTEKEEENRSLLDRLSTLSQSARLSTVDLAKRAEEAERELRWAREGRASAERREKLSREEADAMRSSTASSASAGDTAATGDQSARIKQLERLVETFRLSVDSISRDSREVEERLTQGAGLVKQSTLDQATERISQLEADVQSLESAISQLTSANTTLDAEVNDLMRRVASGEYNPATERCIELRANPAFKIQAVRNQHLEDLQAENEALLERLRSVDQQSTPADGQDSDSVGLVPRQSYERLKIEKEELEQAHAKRLLRLKEIFGNKSKEFLEAVYSLLGWRIKFDEGGADIRMTSMYAPKGKMGLTLRFSSEAGHFGTMQLAGAMAKGLEESRQFWVVERQSVPGFLAQVTTELFEKTTIGQGAGYVGFE